MNGLPWTIEAMAEAVATLRYGGSIGFAFGFEAIEKLAELDARVFAVRPDLTLLVWSVADSRLYAEDELTALASLSHVRHIKISIAKRQSIAQLAKMSALETLKLGSGISIDLDFLPSLENLTELHLEGKFADLAMLGRCLSLQTLYLNTAIDTFSILGSLPGLRSLTVDSCAAPSDLSPLKQTGLESLHLSSVRKLNSVESITCLSDLRNLRLHGAAKMEYLPAFSGLKKLRRLELSALKAWKNPEALQNAAALEYLRLEDINGKITADQLAFLTSLPNLSRVDFRFIDAGKRRRQQMETIFQQAGKFDLVIPYPEAE